MTCRKRADPNRATTWLLNKPPQADCLMLDDWPVVRDAMPCFLFGLGAEFQARQALAAFGRHAVSRLKALKKLSVTDAGSEQCDWISAAQAW